jgi:hypothetical protein
LILLLGFRAPRRAASLAAKKVNPVVRRIHAMLSAVQKVAEHR